MGARNQKVKVDESRNACYEIVVVVVRYLLLILLRSQQLLLFN